MNILDKYWNWAEVNKIRMYVATPLIVLFAAAVVWSFLTWIF